ncbi:MAG TPA: M28 family peptidase [Candidatus Acidoferrales bacterium]|nr:M28 family peptidase [Candidatus Acidoferrales bacterium]
MSNLGVKLEMVLALTTIVLICGCHSAASNPAAASGASSSAAQESAAQITTEGAKAPPASQTGGFDGARAYEQVAKLVSFGPHPPGSDAIRRTQDYIHSQLAGFGCTVDEDSFNAQTPVSNVSMKNIIVKVPGEAQGIILLLTHYDTLRLDNFVGAEDGGSSSGLMLEMARDLCGEKPQTNAVWIAFLDGEEAQLVQNGVAQWTDADSVYGSRELAARMAVAGDLKRVRAVILADMVGQYNLRIERESSSTLGLTDLVWKTAARLGYGNIFVQQVTTVEDDHGPFLKRGVPAVDIIDLDGYQYWHTPQDTLDKVSAASLAEVGHVILTTVQELEKPGAPTFASARKP